MTAERDPPVGMAAFAMCSVAFVVLAAPSVGVRDAGELATAAALVDVPHPTGFVADMVLARLAMTVPFGDLAFRANLVVAIAMGAACGLVARIVYASVDEAPKAVRTTAAALGAAILATSATVLRAATAFEVYALSLFAALVAVDRLQRATPSAHREVALVAGASLLLHTQARPAAALALVVLAARSFRSAGVRRAGSIVASGLLAALPVFYLLVAARAHRPIDWDTPDTFTRLVRHLTAQRIREAFAHRMFVAWRIPEDTRHAVTVLREDLGMLALAVGIAGLVLALRHRALRWVVALGAIDLGYAVLVNPMGIRDRQTLFVSEAALAIGVGFALAKGSHIAVQKGHARMGIAGAVLAGVLVLSAIVRTDFAYAARTDGWSETELLLGGGALGAVPVGSVVLCESDDLCGGSFYAQYVEGERPDVGVVARQHLGDVATWRRLIAHVPAIRTLVANTSDGDVRTARLRALVASMRARVRWEQGDVDDERAARVHLGSGESPVLATIDAPFGGADHEAVAWIAARDARGAGGRPVAAATLVSVGRRAAASDGVQAGVPFWRAALAFDEGDAAAHTNLGVVAARSGDFRTAIALTEEALERDPDRRTAWRNLAQYRRAIGDQAGAESAQRELGRR